MDAFTAMSVRVGLPRPQELHKPFRFLDLPRELRNRVYQELLCRFDDQSADVAPRQFWKPYTIQHCVEPAIMRSSKQVHREAYDEMVKTNKFVLVEADYTYVFRLLLNSNAVPVISSNVQHIRAFKGYVLSVFIASPSSRRGSDNADPEAGPCSVILLARQMNTICKYLADGIIQRCGFTANIVNLTVGPFVDIPVPSYKSSLDDYFTEIIQKLLLEPFRSLRGIKGVQVRGKVSHELANTVAQEMAEDELANGDKWVEDLIAMKHDGLAQFNERHFQEAGTTWMDAAVEIERIHSSTSWNTLILTGGEAYIKRVAELYLTLKLNAAQAQLSIVDGDPHTHHVAEFLCYDCLETAAGSLKGDYWTEGFKYHASRSQLGKLFYGLALCRGQFRGSNVAQQALKYIDDALQMCPNDPMIIKERERILELVREQE